MKIFLTGTTGKVGGYLADYWQDLHRVTACPRSVVDLTDTAQLSRFLEESDFDLLVNPAAVSTPEGCESAPELAEKVNVEAPATMARICREKGVPFIHFSTDYVLDGSEAGLKAEDSPCQPNNLYGRTKLAGEQEVTAAHPEAIVARVSWVFGSAGEGFLEKVFRQIQEKVALEAVADKYSVPTSATEMAKALDFLIASRSHGLFHLTQTAAEPVSWHRYAVEVSAAVHELGLTEGPIPVTPRRMEEIPVLRTNRPVHTAMTPAKLSSLGHEMADWTHVLRQRVTELQSNNSHPTF
ncbi:SDR family oxidoreductase [Roseibacillus persicicus]|uniref:dTDP-4-dehydrorhamnose reductase n=1 Tax=Roseibacillus persicicus TaxID=454148 RepID=A0A918TDR9_9BACT|nr:NAD(P)-dependent oxidoreductase [Roseibacillus persicicus]GHC44285.1 NAD(P)-dependent oxidoreductase [Roseibacillus persicicus]